jgi:hypothetical protein
MMMQTRLQKHLLNFDRRRGCKYKASIQVAVAGSLLAVDIERKGFVPFLMTRLDRNQPLQVVKQRRF